MYNLYRSSASTITCHSRIEGLFGTLVVSVGGGGDGSMCAAILSNSIVSAARLWRNGGTECCNGECVYSAYLMSR